jgi:predicted Zn-dependent protease
MQELTDVSGDSFDASELLAIAELHDDVDDTADTVSYYVLFVDGVFRDDSGERDTVLGVSLGNTRVIAMFKPVIRSTEGPLLAVSRFVEQSVLIHEMGHALGLVANGIALTSAHHDEAHGAHCTNRDCVMYYVNEGASDLALFVRDYITSGDVLLFGSECIADVRAELAP